MINRTVLAFVVLLLASCERSKGGGADKIVIYAGDGQCAFPGAPLPRALEAGILGAPSATIFGGSGGRSPVAGTAVTFTGMAVGGGSDVSKILLQPFDDADQWAERCTVIADAGGRARCRAKLPRKVGQFLVEASFLGEAGEKKRILFRQNSGLSLIGSRQEGVGGSELESPLQVLVVNEEWKPAQGALVRFAIPDSTHKASLSRNWAVTDEKGLASTELKLPKRYTGEITVESDVTGEGISFKGLHFTAMAVDRTLLICGIIGGLAIFLYGMKLMSEGLQRVAGKRLKRILAIFTRNRIVGLLVGTGVTAVIQSSSATTVMVVGFVNAGLIGLRQAMGVMLGADIGTTVTAQIIAFKLNDLALPAIAAGFALVVVTRNQNVRFWGQVLMGFGFLFLGLTLMGDMLKPLRSSPTFQHFFELFDCTPVAGVMPPLKVVGAILIGTGLTVVVQSSSATVGLTMALASAGLINFYTAVPIILGDNIGTTITAILASLTANREAKQAAIAHTLFKVIGVAYMTFLFFIPWGGEPIFLQFVESVTSGKALGVSTADQENIARKIAMTHTFFNLLNACVLLPLLGPLATFVSRLLVIHRDEEGEVRVHPLEPHLLDQPGIALDQVWRQLDGMASLGRKSIRDAFETFRTGDMKLAAKVERRERSIDTMQEEITNYLVALSRRTLTDEESALLPLLMHCVNDLERIGDQAENITEVAAQRMRAGIVLKPTSEEDLKKLFESVDEQFEHLCICLEKESPEEAALVSECEKQTDRIVYEINDRHLRRMKDRESLLQTAILFRDMTAFLERVGDHVNNVAKRLLTFMKTQ